MTIPTPAKLAMVLMGYVPLLHAAGTLALAVLLPGWWRLSALGWLLLVPPLVVRLSQQIRPVPAEAAVGSAAFLRWWWQFQWQIVFNRLPMIEETIRLVPGLYAVWLRLWGARVGRLIYWTPTLRVLDRQLLDLGDGCTFGAGVSLNPHVIGPHPDTGTMTLLAAPIKVGAGAVVGGESTLLPGCWVGPGEAQPAADRLPPPHRLGRRPAHRRLGGGRVTITGRLRTHAVLKFWLGAGLLALFTVGYGGLQTWPLRPPFPAPLTPFDRWVGFRPGWVWVYATVYPMPAISWLATTRRQLARYAAGMTGTMLAAFVVFAVYPTAAAAPPVPDGPVLGRVYRLIFTVDGRANALPSLHVAFAVYHVRLTVRLLAPGRLWRIGLWAWVALIAFSTIATRQHNALDVPAGAALGWLADRLAWRGAA